MIKALLLTAALVMASSQALAQSTDPPAPSAQQGVAAEGNPLTTLPGHEVNISVGHYTYTEPLAQQEISIHGAKIGGEYTGTRTISERRRWFAQANVRGTAGSARYDGFCYPYLIVPNNNSPNGYELGFGDSSPCSETGDSDWYIEARGLVGKDFVSATWGLSALTGLALRHLSNGTTGVAGYRTDDYLYLPLGLTARTRVASTHVLSLGLEYDVLLRGWQTTRGSKLGGGDVPATPTAPAFTINGFSDVSFSQHQGWAIRARATYQFSRRWSVEPTYIHWSVGDSPVSTQTVTFTVNNITAREDLGFYEPANTTDELLVSLGFRF